MAITPVDLSKSALLSRYHGLDTTDPPGLPIYDLNALPTPLADNRAIFARDGNRLTMLISRNGRWVDMMPRGEIPQQEIAHAGAQEGSISHIAGERFTDRASGGFRIFKDFYLGPLAAAGVAYHATITSIGSALDVTAGFSQFLPNRTIQLLPGGGTWNGGNVLLDIEYGMGFATTITVSGLANGVTQRVDSAIHRLIRVRTSQAPTSGLTLDIQTGPGFSVMPLPPFESNNLGSYVVSVDGVVEAPAIVDRSTGTLVPTSVPNGMRRYVVRWIMNQAAHFAPPA